MALICFSSSNFHARFGRPAALVAALLGQQISAQAMVAAADVKELCSPILAAAVTSQVNITRSILSKEATLSWLCSQTYASEETASHSGIDVNGEYSGVRIGLLYSDDQQKRSSARTQLCQGSTATADSAYSLVLTEINRDPVAFPEYTGCVNAALQSQKDLACYFQSNRNDPKSLTLNIIYRPSGARLGKYSKAPTLTGASLDDGKPIFDFLKSLQKQPFDAKRPITAFTAPVPINRPGTSGGSFSLALDDGTSCSASFAPIGAKVKIQIQPIGTALSRTEGRHSYHADQSRNCGDDSQDVTFDTQLPASVVAVTQQDLMSQVSDPGSSNCKVNASKIREVVGVAPDRFRIKYNIVGCGYDFLRACKGRGWIDQYGFIRTRALDTTKPLTVSHTEQRDFPSGKVEIFQASFKQGVEPDFNLTDYFFLAEVSVPDGSLTQGVRNFSLRGYAKNVNAPGAKYCEEWKSNGKTTSIAALVGDNGVVTIFQDDVQCETLRVRVRDITQAISGVSPEAQCAKKLDGLARLPKVPSDKLTPEQVFTAAKCQRTP